jgi:hypothetical protein
MKGDKETTRDNEEEEGEEEEEEEEEEKTLKLGVMRVNDLHFVPSIPIKQR